MRHCEWMPHFDSYTDLAELNLPKTCQMDFPDPNDLLNFKLVISPDEVMWWVWSGLLTLPVFRDFIGMVVLSLALRFAIFCL